MALNAQFTASVRCDLSTLSAANTAVNGTGSLVTNFTSGASGSRIERITVKAQSATTSGVIRFFICTGATNMLLFEMPVWTPSGAETFNETYCQINFPKLFPILLPANYTIKSAQTVTQTMNIIVAGGDY